MCILAMVFILATQDNPLLIPHIKPTPKVSHIRYDDLARHMSLIGAILYLMIVPPVEDAVSDKDHKDKKAKKTN